MNTPEGHALIITEYVCKKCANEFFVPFEKTKFDCPRRFCDGVAEPTGSIKVYIKRQLLTGEEAQLEEDTIEIEA